VSEGINFENTASVRVSGRVLYENTTIPVRNANFLVNGKKVMVNGRVYNTDALGNFEFSVPKGEEFTLQAVKDGHWFAGDGFVSINDTNRITLTKPLDGIRIYDQTKVRLIGRLTGGEIQARKPLGHNLSTNYLGEDLEMVFELEGDNISQIVHIPADLDKDTIQQQIDSTRTLFERKRITIRPDKQTGEYAVDLFPVRYKITQATARGYATLFADGKTSETLDLSDAAEWDKISVYENDTVHFNASYNITYHSPINITCKQLRYGLEIDFFGEESMMRKNILNERVLVPLVTKQKDGEYTYLFGAPAFNMDYYTFRVTAHEDYYYNNDTLSTKHEEVRIPDGTLKVYNGMNDAANTQILTSPLENGQADITVPVNYVSFMKTGESALRVLDLSVEYKGQYVEKQAVKGYVMGNRIKGKDFVSSSHGNIVCFDILRDPPGSQSYAFIEEGTTYKYNYTYELDFNFGLDISFDRGAQVTMSMGSFAGMGGGVYAGYVNNFSTVNTFNLPITSNYKYKKASSYTFTTNQRIETDNEKYFVDQTGNGKYFVGQEADVYIGAVQNVYYGITDAVKPIDSVTYAALKARELPNLQTLKTVTTGRDVNGKQWYLVIGEETEVGTYINSTFVYTHDYIEHTLLPQLRQRRNDLLLTCDSTTAQAIANAQHKPVYWSRVMPTDSLVADSTTYKQIVPTGDTKLYDDEVASLNREIVNWWGLFIQNETEKINAIYGNGKQKLGTFSVSGGTLVTHTETYEYSNAYTKRIDYPGGSLKVGQGVIKGVTNMFGKTVGNQIKNLWSSKVKPNGMSKSPVQIKNSAVGTEFHIDITPIIDLNFDYDPSHSTTHTKKCGFVLEPDNFAHESVSVYRVVDTKKGFNAESEDTREFLKETSSLNLDDNTPDSLYGSYVYFLEGGASRCPYEPAYSTSFYEPTLALSNGTYNLENQKLDINVHERSNVPADQPAIFQLRLTNESEGDYGGAALPITFYLKQAEVSNPHGARLMIDGMPVTGDGRAIKIAHNTVITKTLMVYAGDGYDYENIVLELASPCDPYNKSSCTFSVHYMPVSCNVNIVTPHDKWVMNTLSPQDSTGYYLPVTIDGFDVNYKGFDHVEFQYKLSTQSDDAWVNQCSYYFNDSLYNAASGNKAMITDGRIDNIRFYGERDPMEQKYDLRAVSYCRHGNGFITRASAVLTGTKDTRPPRVFGEPEPANSILGVGDHLLLRFNEAIAGNYLDEDNNFQLLGMTNETGITTGVSLSFDGTSNSYAETHVPRNLEDKSFSIDMLVKPDNTQNREVFFVHGEPGNGMVFGKTADNRLFVQYASQQPIMSKPLDAPITAFTRVIMTYNHEDGKVRFFAGAKEMTDSTVNVAFSNQLEREPFVFGLGYKGSMLEARVWTKALTQAEINNTHLKRLTGYERELLAYYRMNEGSGDSMQDYANGATLYMKGCSWNKRQGYSLHFDGEKSAQLEGDLLARSQVQDETVMFWFKAEELPVDEMVCAKASDYVIKSGIMEVREEESKLAVFPLFTANWTPANEYSPDKGTWVGIDNGRLLLRSGEFYEYADVKLEKDKWYHFVLTVNRTYDNVSVFLNGEMTNSFSAELFQDVSGQMFLGGKGFKGNIDELAFFEQALPKALIQTYDYTSLGGDEMGLMGYLPMEDYKENSNGIIEMVFSPNDKREFRTSEGELINKIVPLFVNPEKVKTELAEKVNAPINGTGELTKLKFDWSFNNDELMINILNRDREINKQSMYITVRDVEDINGNPMASPVTWVAFVDRNPLKWEDNDLDLYAIYGDIQSEYAYIDFQIINNSGKRHQFNIESLPTWLSVDKPYGTIDPMEDKYIRFYYDVEMPAGQYMDIVYLTDEDGLSEPLEVEYTVEALPPYNDVDKGKYPYNMSVCGNVVIIDNHSHVFDTDPNDKIYALYHNKCIGSASLDFNQIANTADVYLTIYGNEQMEGKRLNFVLWKAATGKTFNLQPSETIVFRSGSVVGCGADNPVTFTAAGSETQNITLAPGWNWTSFNIDLEADQTGVINNILTAESPWKEGDLIKNPVTRNFCTYNDSLDQFVGSLYHFRYLYTHQWYSAAGNTIHVSGNELPDQKKMLTLLGGQKWTPLPCLYSEPISVSNALAAYYQNAQPGDLLKSHDRFAVFSQNGKWVGDLQYMRPGEGYFFKRMAESDINIRFYDANSPKYIKQHPARLAANGLEEQPAFHNPNAMTNMTVIAKICDENNTHLTLDAYLNDELVGQARPQVIDGDTLYFLTIAADGVGEIDFRTCSGGEIRHLSVVGANIQYQANAHHGALHAPVLLESGDGDGVRKILENFHVVIIRNGERYDVTGRKLNKH